MDNYSLALLRLKWPTFALCVLLIALAGAGVQHLTFNSDLRALYNSEHPAMQQMLKVEEEFTKRDTVMLIIENSNGSIFEPHILELLQSLTAAAWRMPYASRVDSITNFQYTEAQGDDLIVADLLAPGEANVPERRARLKLVSNTEPAIKGILVSADGQLAVVNISFQAREHAELIRELPTIMSAVEAMVMEHQHAHPDVVFRLSGNHAVNHALQVYAGKDSSQLIPSMLLAMFALLLILFRSWYAAFCSAVIVVSTGVATMGLFGWLGFQTDIVNVISPIVIMTLAVADAVHLLNGAVQGKTQGLSDHDSVVYALRMNFKPIFLTSITTILGVLTFSFTDFPPLQKMALIIAAGVSVAFLLSVTLLPILLVLRPIKVRENANLGPVLERVCGVSIKYHRGIVAVCMLVLLGSALLIPRNMLDESPKIMFEEGLPERAIIELSEEKLAGVSGVDIAIYGSDSDAVYDTEFLRIVDDFAHWLRQQEDVSHVGSITDTIKRLNKNLHGDAQAFYRLPEDRELAAQYILLYEFSLPAGLELTNQLNIDKSGTLISATKRSATASQAVALKMKIEDWFAVNAPDLEVVITGMAQVSSELAYTYLIPSMLQGGVIAVITVSLVLLFALLSVRLGLMGMLTTCFPIAVGYACWALYSGVMGFAVASVAGICLGVVVDFAIHFLTKYRSAISTGRTTAESVIYAFETVARAIWITMIVLVVGFWVLTFSKIGLNSDLGLLTGFVILLAAVFVLFGLPAFLMQFDQRNNAAKPSSENQTQGH